MVKVNETLAGCVDPVTALRGAPCLASLWFGTLRVWALDMFDSYTGK